jgi:DNA-binding NarL/FixJ family response regulator
MNPVTLFLLDDHQILIDGVKALLHDDKRFKVIGEATRPVDALGFLEHTRPDIIITDIQMPGMNGIEFTRLVRRNYPDIRICALTMSGEEGNISEMIDAGISGYVVKNTGKEELGEALLKISGGGTYFSPEVIAGLNRALRYHRSQSSATSEAHITPREKEIIQLIAREYSNERIAETLSISVRTVETHRKNIFRKTETKSVVGLLNWARERGLLS